MWRRDRRAGEILRVGARALERWTLAQGRLALLESRPLPGDPVATPDDLRQGLEQMYFGVSKASATVVLESAWTPVAFVDARSPSSQAQVEALARHRFALNYGDAAEPPSTWTLRLQRRARQPRAVAFGMVPSLTRALEAAHEKVGVTWTGWCPALDWGWHSCKHLAGPRTASWWIWPEQDRLLVARVAAGEVIGLHAGISVDEADDAALIRVVDAEAVRLGTGTPTERISIAEWAQSASGNTLGNGMGWRDVRKLTTQSTATPRPVSTGGTVPA